MRIGIIKGPIATALQRSWRKDITASSPPSRVKYDYSSPIIILTIHFLVKLKVHLYHFWNNKINYPNFKVYNSETISQQTELSYSDATKEKIWLERSDLWKWTGAEMASPNGQPL